jgi:hypothetical protein
MKSTEGEVAKTKTAIKALSTKAKAKKKKGGTTTKRSTRKKTASASRKKTSDTRKPAPKRRRIADEEQTNTTRNRRSDRNRNNSFNYEESSAGSSAQSDDRISWKVSRKDMVGKRRGRRSKDARSNDTTEENWELYDQGVADSDASWNEHYRRLQEFHSTHGHSGVPTDVIWSEEPDFADWVSRQRQLFREIRTGYRIASAREEGRWKRLQVLRFPLDYEKWFWQRKYNELCDILNGGKYTEDVHLPLPLQAWVDRQKSLAEGGAYGRIDSERRKNLEKLGVVAWNGSMNDSSDDEL